MQVCIKQIEAGKPLSAVVCYFKVSFTIKWKKKEELSNRLTEAILKDFPLENIECNKYQLIFVIAEEVLSQPFPFRLKKQLPYHSSALHVFVFVGRQGLRFLVETINTSSPLCARDDG